MAIDAARQVLLLQHSVPRLDVHEEYGDGLCRHSHDDTLSLCLCSRRASVLDGSWAIRACCCSGVLNAGRTLAVSNPFHIGREVERGGSV